MSIESVMPPNHLILCRPLLLPSIFSSIRVFSNKSALCIRWPNYWSFSFNISSSNEYSGLIPLRWTGWITLQSKGLSTVFSNTTVQSCPLLFDPMDCSLPGSSVHGMLQVRILGWLAISFSRESSQTRDQTWVSCIAGRFFTF